MRRWTTARHRSCEGSRLSGPLHSYKRFLKLPISILNVQVVVLVGSLLETDACGSHDHGEGLLDL